MFYKVKMTGFRENTVLPFFFFFSVGYGNLGGLSVQRRFPSLILPPAPFFSFWTSVNIS